MAEAGWKNPLLFSYVMDGRYILIIRPGTGTLTKMSVRDE